MDKPLVALVAVSLATLIAFAGAPAKAQEGAKVVVLDFEDEGAGLKGKQSAQMADRLSGIMEKSGKYEVVPRDEYRSALAAHEKTTGQPCQTTECKRTVARSMGAHAVEPKVSKQGGGCAVSLGVAGGGGEAIAGGTVKGGCSMKGMAIGMDGAMLRMTHQIVSEQPLPEIEAIKADAKAAAEGLVPKEIIITTDAEEAEAELQEAGVEVEEQVDEEAEARAVQNEEEAARKLGY